VLNGLSEQIRECLLHAEGCAQQAAVRFNPLDWSEEKVCPVHDA